MLLETKTSSYRKKFKSLDDDFTTWEPHFLDLSNYMMPRKGRFLNGETRTNDGSNKNQKIINESAYDAIRIIGAGMQGGMTSPSRPWFRMTLPDEELLEYEPVKMWLHDVRGAILSVLAKTNFYGSVHGLYMELATYGTGAILMEEDFEKVIRFRPFTIGEYRLGLDAKYRTRVLYRRFELTASQVIEAFGEEKVSPAVKTAYDNGDYKTRFDVRHCIEPNNDVDPTKKDGRGMAFKSIYYEEKGDADTILREAGYRSLPFVAPRWDVTSTDTYGNSAGMAALGDCKMLQKMEEKKLKGLDKQVDPPMNADSSLKSKGGTIVTGGVNYIDGFTQGSGKGMAPVYQVSPDLNGISNELANVEDRIRRFFYNDLFLSILTATKRMTATEVAERHEEKLLMLGPTLERLQHELLEPVIERTFNIMESMGLIPEPPVEMQGMETKIEYISMLAQAQKLVSTTGIEQVVGFAGNLAGIKPDIIDKIDFEEAVDQYAESVGVPPKIVRSDDRVSDLREERAKAEQAAQQQEQMMQGVEAAKLMSETNLDKNSALDTMRAATV